jgi:hypothetical protein
MPIKKGLTASNGVILTIVVGTNSVTVVADEVLTGIDPVTWADVAKIEKLPAKRILLKSGGDSVAELKIPFGKTFAVEGNQGHYDSRGQATMKGDATVRISSPGGSPVVVKADEIYAVPR